MRCVGTHGAEEGVEDITALIAEVQDDVLVESGAVPTKTPDQIDTESATHARPAEAKPESQVRPRRASAIDMRLREVAIKQAEQRKVSLSDSVHEIMQPQLVQTPAHDDTDGLRLSPPTVSVPTVDSDLVVDVEERWEEPLAEPTGENTETAEPTELAADESARATVIKPSSVRAWESQADDLAEIQPFGDPWYVPIETLSPAQKSRRARIRNVLGFYYNRQLDTVHDSPWSMMHHMIAWGSDSLIWTGTPGQGKRVSCIGWLCANGVCEGERLLYLKNGKIYPRVGPGLQGHEGQFLAMLAQARVPAKQPIRVNGQMFTVHDLIRQEQVACRTKTELTFRLIGLIHYLDTDTTWQSSDGQRWDFPRLIREEIAQPINGTTCGGTHRLMGLSYAVRRRVQEGRPIDGQWNRADKYTADYRNHAYAMRNRDGSCSSDFWRSRGTWGDIDRKLKTSGHVLEWMVFSSPHEELENAKLVQSIDFLTMLLAQNRYYDWGKGALGHAVRALSLYDERVFGGVPGERDLQLARRPPRIVPKEKQLENQQATKKGSLRRAFMFRRQAR